MGKGRREEPPRSPGELVRTASWPPLVSDAWPLPDEAAVGEATAARARLAENVAALLDSYWRGERQPGMPPFRQLSQGVKAGQLAEALGGLLARTDAAWWLERRDWGAVILLGEVFRDYRARGYAPRDSESGTL